MLSRPASNLPGMGFGARCEGLNRNKHRDEIGDVCDGLKDLKITSIDIADAFF